LKKHSIIRDYPITFLAAVNGSLSKLYQEWEASDLGLVADASSARRRRDAGLRMHYLRMYSRHAKHVKERQRRNGRQRRATKLTTKTRDGHAEPLAGAQGWPPPRCIAPSNVGDAPRQVRTVFTVVATCPRSTHPPTDEKPLTFLPEAGPNVSHANAVTALPSTDTSLVQTPALSPLSRRPRR
jgi:hypothetical protein